eukprot:CAMPEP_0185029002 /NCGR_PEP_ID=MMETSP1103-20130426/15091_1 /TAXON_ID=36769 /ORGANISM="Paraphysomonas bandaiensis, Strain Caron Lab Isolate" /LENGTH=504 /DNA_ID=CAMNT_0027563601 /DNA_START=64 /DNA_END=1578 /DNA_ORIENTATION=+
MGAIELSCDDARDVDVSFCDMVNWQAAHAYDASNFSLYYPGNPLTAAEQDSYARALYKSMRSEVTSTRPSCKNALKRLACANVFSECPESGDSISSISYFPTCALQCQLAENFCSQAMDCSNYTTGNCMVILPPGFFVLSQEQGPYYQLPGIYGAVLGAWIIITTYWHVAAFILYKDSSVVICKAISTIPVVKVLVLILGVSFWATCEKWKMCSFWLGVSLINTHLVFETGMMVCFLLIAKGWSITRDNFSANEWRGIIMSMSAFYMCNSIILVLESSVLDQRGFWIANTLLYGLMYLYIILNVQSQLRLLTSQVQLLGDDVPQPIAGPLRMKHRMYIFFLVLVLLNISFEVYLHSLLASSGKMWKVLLVYEVSNLLILGTVGYIFRPREYSPFFFMVQATMNDNRTRPIPLIEGTEDSGNDAEIELSPLLQSQNSDPSRVSPNTAKMVLIRNPNNTMTVGVSAANSHSRGPSFQPMNVTGPPPPPQSEENRGGSNVMDLEFMY